MIDGAGSSIGVLGIDRGRRCIAPSAGLAMEARPLLPHAAADLALAYRDWLRTLKDERRLAAKTCIAYASDVTSFVSFLVQHVGGAPSLPVLADLRPADFRAWLAHRHNAGLARSSTVRAMAGVRSLFAWL